MSDSKKGRLKNFEYGNYFDYNRKRNPHETDSRFELLKKEWFEGKDVLDIGCNLGDVTNHIAKNCCPHKIVGIDIDGKLIGCAQKNIRKHLDLKNGTYTYPTSLYLKYGPLIDEKPRQASTIQSLPFPDNLCFVVHDYVPADDEQVSQQKPYYDVILCLSVSKWIHLNYCDDGLKRAFKRMFNHLRPGGRLILEYQPFDNYKRRKKLSPRLNANYEQIKMKPNDFEAFLLSKEVGFYTLELNTTTNHDKRGFRRPFQVFRKASTQPDVSTERQQEHVN